MSSSESEEETSMTESPNIVKQGSSQESEEYESEEDQEEEPAHSSTPNIEAVVQNPFAGKPSIKPSPPGATGPARALKPTHPSYENMVLDAMKILDENKRTGVSISKILSFVTTKNALPATKTRLFFKKAIEKGITNKIYAHTTGTGFSGSIKFSAEYRNKLKKEQAKELRDAAKPVSKAKPQKTKTQNAKTTKTKKVLAKKAEQKAKTTKAKTTKAKKDTNNNSATAAVARKKAAAPGPKAAISKTSGKIRLSIGAQAVTKGKPKPSGAGTKKTTNDKLTAGTTSKQSTRPARSEPKKAATAAGPTAAKQARKASAK